MKFELSCWLSWVVIHFSVNSGWNDSLNYDRSLWLSEFIAESSLHGELIAENNKFFRSQLQVLGKVVWNFDRSLKRNFFSARKHRIRHSQIKIEFDREISFLLDVKRRKIFLKKFAEIFFDPETKSRIQKKNARQNRRKKNQNFSLNGREFFPLEKKTNKNSIKNIRGKTTQRKFGSNFDTKLRDEIAKTKKKRKYFGESERTFRYERRRKITRKSVRNDGKPNDADAAAVKTVVGRNVKFLRTKIRIQNKLLFRLICWWNGFYFCANMLSDYIP